MLPDQTNPNSRDAAAMLNAGAALAKPYERKQGQPPVFVLPEGYKLAEPSARDYVAQQVTTDSPQAFVGYVKKYGSKDSLVLESLPDSAVGLLDYHAGDKPRPNRHKINLRREADPAFLAWDRFVSRGAVSQTDFAEFLDEHNADIIKPTAGEALDLVRNVEAKTSVSFSSVILASGLQKVVYAEDQGAKAGEKGSLEVPREITIAAPLFRNGGHVELRIRVRLAIRDSRLTFKLAWLNKDEALRKDAEEMGDWLRKQLEGTCAVQRGTEGAAD